MADYVSPYLKSDRFDELLSPSIQPPRLRLAWHEGELWLTEKTTGLLVNVGNRQLLPLGIFTVGVRGTKYYAPMVKAADLTPGTLIELVREPENINDSNAIGITKGDLFVGYWNQQMARPMAKLLDAGTHLEAILLAGTPSGKATERVRVLAAEPQLLAHLQGKRVPRSAWAGEEEAPAPRSFLGRLFGR